MAGVGMVAIRVYGTTVNIVRLEFGHVRVNYQIWTLPISLENGKVRLSQSGLSVIVETDFGLTVKYDWQEYLVVEVPGSFAGTVCGLCGNFNSKKEDDFVTPSGSLAGDVVALGESWKVSGLSDDAFCHNECSGQCKQCMDNKVQQIEYKIICSSILAGVRIYFPGCHPLIDLTAFQNNCVFDLCMGKVMKTYFCDSLQIFSDICQRAGVKGRNWRSDTKCPLPKCPENSHYEFCGTACPATCENPDAPSQCKAGCVEACVCDDGFLLSGTKCVPKAQCGCTYEGYYVEAGATFWEENCSRLYKCSAGGRLSTQETGCPAGHQCQVVKGIRNCYPVSYATCMVSGDPHFVTFDGEHYNFQGTCAYQMAGVSSRKTDLEHFSVVLQNDGRDKKLGSVVKLVEVKVFNNTIVINKESPGFVMVNGELSTLPMTLDGEKLKLYTSGWFAVIETSFGARVYYDSNSVAFVIVPSSYSGAMRGLCGNYNRDPKDDMLTRDDKQATSAESFGQSWKVATIPGCVNGCQGPCPVCNNTQKDRYKSDKYCGLIADPAGPFRDCHSKVSSSGFLEDCLYDVCLYQGSKNMQCKTLTAYTAACQLKGAKVYPWRSAHFCDATCPSNGHYELCVGGCPATCQASSAAPDCGAPCMEGCACDEGFVPRGNECVPLARCGCVHEGKRYQHGQVFYPDELCRKECVCNGTVQCKTFSCGANEKCELKNGVRSCQPFGRGVCSIYGDPHYRTFDNSTYSFQGTCTYTAAEGCHLEATRLNPFSVVVENEKWYGLSADPRVSVAKVLAVEVYGTILILRRNQIGMVTVNGLLSHLPLSLLNGKVKVYQEGINDVITTDFGLRVTYDLVYHVTVSVPGNYRGKACGLCGNFNGDKADDFRLPDGRVTKDLVAFGASWKVGVPGVVCDDGCSGDRCVRCDGAEKAALERDCGVIADPEGPFAACHAVIDPASYFADCVFDVCVADGNAGVLCRSIGAYVLDCRDFGVKTRGWRSPSFCPLLCPSNSHYESCARPCTAPCPGLSAIMACSSTCAEGCACDGGFFYNGTGCVSQDQCSCYYDGHTYKIGESFMTDDCQKIHTCQASGVVLSQSMTCDSDEKCQVKNGAIGCYPQQCVLGAGGTLTLFSGEAGSVTEPGFYEILKVFDQAAASDWFRVVVKFDLCGTPAVNTVMAVYIFFDETVIAINNQHAVWVNGRKMTQPSFTRANVNVVVSGKTVTVDSISGLRLSFSQSSELTMTVGEQVAERVCGACRPLSPSTEVTQLLPETIDVVGGLTSNLPPLNTWKWKAPDFPQCGV
ncbi:IgGFc-binding protein-like [Lampris incognitus]|uniref:IgGFc-binding protein-like n=1 Tax=Lampris incognitus TaxID=2546036 RepID=UPI0024B4D359|nr:IgGFc-binding protein-like [Lampris incognitus]